MGGIESASLTGILPQYFAEIYPIYVCFGLAWENIEQQFLLKYLNAIAQPKIKPLKILDQPIKGIYQDHWSVSGENVPDANSEDEEGLSSRQKYFLSYPSSRLVCFKKNIFLAPGTLGSNPFPDASEVFFDCMQEALRTGLNYPINIFCPFANMHKRDVIVMAKHLPLHLTFSCINPVMQNAQGVHCGKCNKCAERQKGFADAQVEDHTPYAGNGRGL